MEMMSTLEKLFVSKVNKGDPDFTEQDEETMLQYIVMLRDLLEFGNTEEIDELILHGIKE